LYFLFLLIFLPIFYITTKKRGYNPGIKERFVFYKDKLDGRVLWFHCASVGEINTIFPIIEHYSKNFKILLTVSSPRGKDYALRKVHFAKVRFLPFDFTFLIKKFVKMYNPKILIIGEGEFWFGFITESSRFLPVISVNTRISEKSFKNYKKYQFFYKKLFNSFTKFLVRSEQDKKFLEKLVHDKRKIVVCGDMKLVSSSAKKEIEFDKNSKKILIAGSTHYPEENIILKVFKEIKKEVPDLALILAPRHLERLEEIEKLVKNFGFDYDLRTETKKLNKDVYIVNTLGELSGFYRYADVVFVGGTFAKVGGHNILEPVLENKPVVIGPYHDKIKDIYQELKRYGIVKAVKTTDELKREILNYLNKEPFKIDLEQKQKEILECYLKNIDEVLKEKI
jgi:3-deoxy-D-manno-octulosonic-acid transferase